MDHYIHTLVIAQAAFSTGMLLRFFHHFYSKWNWGGRLTILSYIALTIYILLDTAYKVHAVTDWHIAYLLASSLLANIANVTVFLTGFRPGDKV